LYSSSDIGVEINDGVSNVIPGTQVTFTITVVNNGPSRVEAPDLTVTDLFDPSYIRRWSWTCVSASGSATCGTAAGGPSSGPFSHFDGAYPGGSSLKFLVTTTVNPAATGYQTTLVNRTLLFTIDDTNSTNDVARDTNRMSPQADVGLAIVSENVISGAVANFSFILTNYGPSDAPAVSLTSAKLPDVLLALINVSCTPLGPSTACTSAHVNSSKQLEATAYIPAGGRVIVSVFYVLDSYFAGNISIAGSSRVLPPVKPLVPPNDNANSTFLITKFANFQITKAPTVKPIPLGIAFTYRITITNLGPSAVSATVRDELKSYLADPIWSCSASNNAVCGAALVPNGNILNDTDLFLPVNGKIEYKLVSVLDAEGGKVQVVNSVNVTALDGSGFNETTSTAISDSGTADYGISKSASRSQVNSGDTVEFTLTISNNGPDARFAKVTDDLQGYCNNPSWTCSCPSSGDCEDDSGNGNLNTRVLAPVGSSCTIKITCPTQGAGTFENQAIVSTRGDDPNGGNNQATATVTISPPCSLFCPDGVTCADRNICPISNTDTSIAFDKAGGFQLSAGQTSLSLAFKDIKELDSDGYVIYAESLQDQDFNVTSSTMLSATGKEIANVNFTATLHNGAFFRVAYYIFTEPDIFPVGPIVLEIAGSTNKFSIIVADWPFEDFDVHSLQIDFGFETCGKLINDPCLLESSSSNRRVTQSQFQTKDGIISVQVLQFATLDGVETEVSAEVTSKLLILTTPSFFVDMIYDPDFSLLLGGGSNTGGGCSSTNNDALLNASIAALAAAFGFAGCVIAFYVVWDKRKKYLRKAAREKAQAAYKTGVRPVGSHSSAGTWGVNV